MLTCTCCLVEPYCDVLPRVKLQFATALPLALTKNEASTVKYAVFIKCPAYAQIKKGAFISLFAWLSLGKNACWRI